MKPALLKDKTIRHLSLFIAAAFCSLAQAAPPVSPPGAESLVLSYDTPGDSSTALPVGNGDIGVQSWVEPNGDLVMLIGKTDAWGEQCNLLKLGKVRIKLDPPLMVTNGFRQELKMHDGVIEIQNPKSKISVWVDANHPVVRVETTSDTPVSLSVALELWRKARTLPGNEHSFLEGTDINQPPREWPDTVVNAPTGSLKNHLVWYHRNEHSVYPASLRIQEIEAAKGDDPLLNRTFGCAIGGNGFVAKSPTLLVSAQPATRQTVTIHPLTLQTPTADGWLQALGAQTAAESARNAADCYAAHVQWWRAFWQRSWVSVSGGKPEEAKEIANINTGWHAHRYLIACTARGNSPIKFNASIFNVEKYHFRGQPADWVTPDFRNWDGALWFQNQRHLYWPMLAAGDHDQFAPFFKMYRDALPLAEKRTKIYYKHDGAYFPETMLFFGTWYNSGISGYGGNRKGKELGLADSEWIRYYWQGGIELSAMMLDYYRHTGDEAFVRETLLPVASSIVTFYDQHYKRGADGKIWFSPAQVLETYWDVDNPMPEIAGLRCVLPGLLALPENLTTAEQRQAWRRMFGELPALPEKTINGKTSLWDAQNIRGSHHNAENGRLYAVWPYRLFGVGMPELDKAMNAWETRPFKYRTHACWHNDILWAAYLGMPDQARTKLGARLSSKNFRFPAMFMDGDWIPDHDNGGVCQNTIQAMLMQTVGDRILLLPAWPKHWDVKFKLHAPKNTTVECEFRNGKVVKLEVLPASRKKDVQVFISQ